MNPSSDHPSPSFVPVNPIALAAGAAAALAGAVLWAAIAYFTGYEIGYIAWAVGGLVGFAVAKTGGRGPACAVAAAVITVLGIFGGKLGANWYFVEHGLDEEWSEMLTPQLYAEMQTDAQDFAALGPDPGEAEVRRFMVEHRYTDAPEPARVDEVELADFDAWQRPVLVRFTTDPPTFEEWQERAIADARASLSSELSLASAVVEDLGPIDLIFAFLAISTAFGLVQRAGGPGAGPEGLVALEDESAEAPERRRAA
jgi:hypothetical protein